VAYDGPEAPYAGWRAYFHTGDVDALAVEFRARRLAFRGPATTEYHMREIEVTDPDGNTICFGQDFP
jgi:catechol 2,3-dioxygenase-like lactoylglutathione lyase family enzyme